MDIKQFVSKIYAFSKVGIKYSKDPYALENYHELKVLAEQQMHEENYLSEAGILYPKDAYPTPSVSVRVLVFKAGKLLMVQEKDDLKYCVPGGWCDVFESPKEAAIKEVEQETGLKVRIVRVLGIFMRDKYKPKPSMVSEYCLYFLAEIEGGKLIHNHELLSANFYDLSELPELSFKTSPFELGTALSIAQDGLEPYFD